MPKLLSFTPFKVTTRKLACYVLRTSFLMLGSLVVMLSAANAASNSNVPLNYGAWNFECKSVVKDAKNETCIAKQLVTKGQSKKKVLLGVMVGYLAEHPSAHILFRINPQADIAVGAMVKIDEFKSFNVPISNCDGKVCEVRSFIPEDMLSQMLKGKVLLFRFVLNGKAVTYPVSLQGFDKTYAELEANAKLSK